MLNEHSNDTIIYDILSTVTTCGFERLKLKVSRRLRAPWWRPAVSAKHGVPDRLLRQNGHYPQKRRCADRLWLALDAARARFFQALLLLGIVLGWDRGRFQALE